jgi:hypothetical protein
VAAEGEHQAAEKLAQAARVIGTVPGAMQLRQLQTMVEVSAEKNSTLIFPVPIELMQFAQAAVQHLRNENDEDAGSKIKIDEQVAEAVPIKKL